jgi:hypothetical protein
VGPPLVALALSAHYSFGRLQDSSATTRKRKANVAINWQQIIATLAATIGGGGLVLTAVGWLTKTLISNLVARDAERLTIEMKATADKEIERVRAFLMRAARVHERQVDTLTKLYRHLFEAQAYLQRMAATARFEGEPSIDEYRRLCANSTASAREICLDGRLLIPSELTLCCDQFFSSLFQGHTHLAFAQHPMIVDGLQRAEFWDKAKVTAYQEVPKILEQIEKAARDVIHGEP